MTGSTLPPPTVHAGRTPSVPVAQPVRRAAAIPLPLAGESLTSWLDTVARRGGIRRSTLLGKWGIQRPLTDNLVAEEHVHKICAATGLLPDEIIGMTFQNIRNVLLPGRSKHPAQFSRPRLARDSIFDSESSWCPRCLHEAEGRWYLRWKLGWSFACVEHRVLLVTRCPACSVHPGNLTYPPEHRVTCEGCKPEALAAMDFPLRSRKGWEVCGFPLAQVPVRGISSKHLLKLQAQIQEFFARPYSSPRGAGTLPYWVLPLARAIMRFEAWQFAEGIESPLAEALEADLMESTTFRPPLGYPAKVAAAVHAAHRLASTDDHGLITQFADLATEVVAREEKGRPYRFDPTEAPGRGHPGELAKAASNIFPPAVYRELRDRGLLVYLPDLVINRYASPRV